MSAARVLDLRDLGLRVGFVRLDYLRPHEEVEERGVSSLVESMRSDGFQSDPLMVDAATMSVLDGAHRLAALRELGARWAAVALVDYEDPGIELGRWLRSLDPGSAREAAEEGGMAKVEDWRRAAEAVDSSRGRAAVLMPSGPSYLSRPLGGCLEAHRVARGLWGRGSRVALVPDPEVEGALGSGAAVVYVPVPLKVEVVVAAASGDLFPPRSTRHVFGARPVGLDVPLEVLRSEEPDLELLRRRAAGARVLPPNSEFRGRRYEDRLVVFG